MAVKNKPNEINLVRVYNASVKDVWEAWIDPKKAAKWWGPRGFTITTHSKDFKVGGVWHYTMHGPDGTNYPNKTKYFEIDEYAKLVYDHGGYDDREPIFRVTVLFSEKSGKTAMDMTMTLPTEEAAKETRKFIKLAGGNSTWDRLAEYIDKETTGKDNFVINRSFDAPISRVFEMWTNPKYFSRWLAPTGFDMEFIRADIKPGGSGFYVMHTSGNKMHGHLEYVEIHKPDKVVYIQQFCDEKENITRAPFEPNWPKAMLTTITLTEEDINQTRVTVTWEPHGHTTGTEIETFLKERSNMTQGWTGSFEKLEHLLLT